MNKQFWQWLAHVDARIAALILISICAALSAGAILHIGFAGWGESGSIEGWESVDEAGTTNSGLVASSSLEKPATLPDPFTSRYFQRFLSELDDLRKGQTQPEPVVQEPPAEETEPVPAKPPRIARLVYHGVMERPDATEMALIEDPVAGTMKFYSIGEGLDAFTVKNFDARQLLLSGGEDGTWKLPVNHPTEIEVRDP
jgi:hypothetical protein